MAVAQNPWASSLRGFAKFGDRVAVSSRGRTLTYAELVAQAKAVCAAVIEAGAKPGEVIAIVARNGPGVVVGELWRDGKRRGGVRGRSQSRAGRYRLRDANPAACGVQSSSAASCRASPRSGST